MRTAIGGEFYSMNQSDLKFPVIEGFPPRYPKGGKPGACPLCGRSFTGQIVYVEGGATPTEGMDEELKGFLDIGVHTSSSEGIGNRNVEVVKDSFAGQFDLTFCSVACLERFFAEIVKALKK